MQRSPDRVPQPTEPPSAVLHPVVTPQEVGPELVEARAADLSHDKINLAAEDVDHLLDAGESTRDGAVESRPAKEHELSAETEGDQYVGAAAHAAVEHHCYFIADRRLDCRQRLQRGWRLVELASAMVRDDDAVYPDLGSTNRIRRVQDALDDGARGKRRR